MSEHPDGLPPEAVVALLARHMASVAFWSKDYDDAARDFLAALGAEGHEIVPGAEARAVAALLAAGEELNAESKPTAGTITERVAAIRRLRREGYKGGNDEFVVSFERVAAFVDALANPALRSLAARLAGTAGAEPGGGG